MTHVTASDQGNNQATQKDSKSERIHDSLTVLGAVNMPDEDAGSYTNSLVPSDFPSEPPVTLDCRNRAPPGTISNVFCGTNPVID